MDPIKTTAVTDAEGNFDVTVTVGGGPGIKNIGVQAGETGALSVTSAQSVPAPGATTTGGPRLQPDQDRRRPQLQLRHHHNTRHPPQRRHRKRRTLPF